MRFGLADADWAAWTAMEKIRTSGKALALGISNVNLDQLQALVKSANIMPTFVQNRCYASTGWDRAVRTFCKDQGIVYQGFSLLTANANELNTRAVHDMALRHGKTIPQVAFRFARHVGMLPLTGTTSPAHMEQDLACMSFDLSSEEVAILEKIGERKT